MANKMERFTQRARRVLFLAQLAAEHLQHDPIGTEHLLIGLIHEEEGVAGKVLRNIGLTQHRVEELVSRMTESATERVEGTPPDLSLDTKRVLELAVEEARRLESRYIGTEHLLLALASESNGQAIEVLKQMGVSQDEVRRQVQKALQEERKRLHPPGSVGASGMLPARTIASAVEPHVHSQLLLRLLYQLAQLLNEAERKEMRVVIEKLLDEVVAMHGYTHEVRAHLLPPIVAPFKSSERSKLQMRVRITDKSSGQVISDLNNPLAQAKGLLEHILYAVNTAQTGQVFAMDDGQRRIEISIDYEQEAGAAAGSSE